MNAKKNVNKICVPQSDQKQIESYDVIDLAKSVKYTNIEISF